MKYSAISDVGRRYEHNEDYCVLPKPNKNYGVTYIDKKHKGSIFILCDGIGGANAGEVASELTAIWIFREYYKRPANSYTPQAMLEEAIIRINHKIFTLAEENNDYYGMGSTLAATLFIKDDAFIYSIGDSRVYLFRENELRQITEDQSEVWDLYKKGEITKDEIRTHPRNNIITIAIGVEKNMKIEDTNRYHLNVRKKDLFLVCSDGLTDMVSDEKIASVLRLKITLKQKTTRLVDLANANGGWDNITIILISI